MNFQIIDIIFVIFIVIMAIIGYIKGFITRVYDLVGTIIVFILASMLTKPVSSIVTLYDYPQTDIFAQMLGQMMNRCLIFVMIFIVLWIIKKVLGMVIKPLLQGIIEMIPLGAFTNGLLGMGLSVIEGLLLTYFIAVFIWLPLSSDHLDQLHQSVLVSHIVDVVPDVSSQMMDLAKIYQNEEAFTSDEMMLKMTLMAYQMDLIDEQQVKTIFEDHLLSHLDQQHLSLSSSQIEQLQDILYKNGYNKEKVQEIISKINESGNE